MHKFKVGDIIIGNKKNVGAVSGVGSICKVIRVFEFYVEGFEFYVEGTDMEIYVIKGNYPGENVNASSRMFNLHKSNFRRVP